MIKIIKAGQKEFYAFCTHCGCEFTYELSDLNLSNNIKCPTCGRYYYHPSKPIPKQQFSESYRDITWPVNEGISSESVINKSPCADCAWYKQLQTIGLYVGDSPCTWCSKGAYPSITNQIAGKSISIMDSTTPCINVSDVSWTGKVSCNCDENAVCSICSSGTDTTTLLNDSVDDILTCLHRGDTWSSIKCEAHSSDTSTETVAKASVTQLDAKVKEMGE